MKFSKPLPRCFYNRDTNVTAKELLGKFLVKTTPNGNIVAKIVEVEAYRGSDDPASHAYRGKTSRNQLMFGQPGFAYVYFVYGNHHCLNVTTEQEGVPGAVLIRAVEIVEGLELALENRKPRTPAEISNGPGKLTKALEVTKTHNGLDLTDSDKLCICASETNEKPDVIKSKRVGIKAGANRLWRYYMKDNKFVSKPHKHSNRRNSNRIQTTAMPRFTEEKAR